MFALVAAVILFLHGVGPVLEDTADVNWLFVGLGFFFLHFALSWAIPVRNPLERP